MVALIIVGGTMFAIGLSLKCYWKEAGKGVERSDNQEMVEGILFVILGHLVNFLISVLFAAFFSANASYFNFQNAMNTFFALIFISQLLYVVPGTIESEAKKRHGITKGIMLAAGLTFMISVLTCAGPCLSNKGMN